MLLEKKNKMVLRKSSQECDNGNLFLKKKKNRQVISFTTVIYLRVEWVDVLRRTKTCILKIDVN